MHACSVSRRRPPGCQQWTLPRHTCRGALPTPPGLAATRWRSTPSLRASWCCGRLAQPPSCDRGSWVTSAACASASCLPAQPHSPPRCSGACSARRVAKLNSLVSLSGAGISAQRLYEAVPLECDKRADTVAVPGHSLTCRLERRAGVQALLPPGLPAERRERSAHGAPARAGAAGCGASRRRPAAPAPGCRCGGPQACSGGGRSSRQPQAWCRKWRGGGAAESACGGRCSTHCRGQPGPHRKLCCSNAAWPCCRRRLCCHRASATCGVSW